MAVLEQRLSDNKENLLEKELVLEEVTDLTEKLEKRSESGKSQTQKTAQKISHYQGEIRNMNRKTMAIVSELSMYQATAIKLEEEKTTQEDLLTSSQKLFERGKAPNEQAANEFNMLQRQYRSLEKSPLQKLGDSNRKNFPTNNAIRTTAEPRPTAYIPEDDAIGVPKPVSLCRRFYPLMIFQGFFIFDDEL